MTTNRFLLGDAAERLRELPDASIDTVITSPPYFALRDYGTAGQLGLEASVGDWVENLTIVCRELARALKPTGSFWLNLGDSFSRHPRYGAPAKGLLLAPERLLLRLAAEGWIVRNRVAWCKTNSRPSSVRDRLTCCWEPLYLLVRSRYYFFDLDLIRRPPRTRRREPRPDTKRADRAASTGALAHGDNSGLRRLDALGLSGHPLGANPGDVLTTAASNYRGGHVATFPVAMVEPLLRATCPEKACLACGCPWQRESARRLGELAVLGQLRPDCRCRASTVPGLVLDPFSGAGTVALVAEQHGRRWLGIELNPAYVRLAQRRLQEARAGPKQRAA